MSKTSLIIYYYYSVLFSELIFIIKPSLEEITYERIWTGRNELANHRQAGGLIILVLISRIPFLIFYTIKTFIRNIDSVCFKHRLIYLSLYFLCASNKHIYKRRVRISQ